jgi:molybdenum cofactor cytidylyltransferase
VSTAAVILAAGFSRRLGRPKQTLKLAGETLVERAARVATEAGLSPIFIVVNRDADFCDTLEQRGYCIVMNERAAEGMASSIRRGITAAQTFRVSGAVLMTCDQIELDAAHLHRLAANQDRITASMYAGRKGIPAYFPSSSFNALFALSGDTGARDLLRPAEAIINEALAIDIDTEADAATLA